MAFANKMLVYMTVDTKIRVKIIKAPLQSLWSGDRHTVPLQ
jgi:hypothetical protein